MRITLGCRIVFTFLIFVAAMISINLVFAFAGVANAFMAFPNPIGLLFLSGLVAKITCKTLGKNIL